MAGRYKVGEIMSQNVVVATSDESVYNCARKMSFRKIGSVIVIDEDVVVGVLTEQDIARKVVAKGLVPRATPVSTVMSSDVVSVSPYEDIEDAIRVMGQNEIKHLPVIDKNNLVGVITSKDIVAIEPILMDMLKFNNSSNNNNLQEDSGSSFSFG